jgi:hypothetical protein
MAPSRFIEVCLRRFTRFKFVLRMTHLGTIPPSWRALHRGMAVAKLRFTDETIMKKINLLWSASLVVALMNIPVAGAQDDRRDDRRYDRRDDSRDDRRGNWWEGIIGGNTGSSTRDDRRDLEGTWYLNGERDKRTEISSSRDGLEAKNERGNTSRLEISRDGDVYARDWGSLRGNLRRDRIEWENGTTWTREPSGRAASRR